MFKTEKNRKVTLRVVARLLLLSLVIHTFSVHGFAETLVYCFEENGDVNVEVQAKDSFLFNTESEVHEDKCLDTHSEMGFHQTQESHHDIPVSILCSEKDKLTRFDQNQTISFIESAITANIQIVNVSRIVPESSVNTSDIPKTILSSLKTVVLLN